MDGKLLRDVLSVVAMVAAMEVAMQLRDSTSALRLRLSESGDELRAYLRQARETKRVSAEMWAELETIFREGVTQ